MISLASLSDYGTHDDSEFPELWQGCVGAWAPCLGPTGLRLHDFSRGVNWGTLTNMEPETDWVVNSGQYALDFDGSSETVLAATSVALQKAVGYTISCFIYRKNNLRSVFFKTGSASNVGVGMSVGQANSGDNNGDILNFLFDGLAWRSTGYTVPTLQWIHVAMTVWNTANSAYANGAFIMTETINSNDAGNTVFNIGGFAPNGRIARDTLIDDVLVYNRVLNPEEIRLLSRQRGIAYTPRRRRRRYAPEAISNTRRRRYSGSYGL